MKKTGSRRRQGADFTEGIESGQGDAGGQVGFEQRDFFDSLSAENMLAGGAGENQPGSGLPVIFRYNRFGREGLPYVRYHAFPRNLRQLNDLALMDGHGKAHPARLLIVSDGGQDIKAAAFGRMHGQGEFKDRMRVGAKIVAIEFQRRLVADHAHFLACA